MPLSEPLLPTDLGTRVAEKRGFDHLVAPVEGDNGGVLEVGALPEELRTLLGQIVGAKRPTQGDAAQVALVDAEAGSFAVKYARGAPGIAWLEREHEALLALAGTALPIPRAHAFVRRDAPAGREAWLLMDALPGETVEAALARTHDSRARGAILAAFGDALRRLHATAVPPTLSAADEQWIDRILREAGENLAAGRAEAEGTAALLERLRRERPPPAPPALIHGDCTIDNVLFASGRVTGLIDWSGAAEGDRRYDLALATRPKPVGFRDPADLEVFYAGYGADPLPESERAYFVDLYEFF